MSDNRQKRREALLYEENMQIVTVGVSAWIVKEEDGQYVHRPEGEYGVWRLGIPPGVLMSEVAWTFQN
jgi:hypothetical protein